MSEVQYHLAVRPLEQHFIEEKCRTEYKEEIILPFNSFVSTSVHAVPTGICPGLQN